MNIIVIGNDFFPGKLVLMKEEIMRVNHINAPVTVITKEADIIMQQTFPFSPNLGNPPLPIKPPPTVPYEHFTPPPTRAQKRKLDRDAKRMIKLLNKKGR